MPALSIPRLLIGGAEEGVGKTLLTLGIIYELRRRGLSVSVCITNSNLALSLIYRRIAGRYVRSLDPRILSPGQILDGMYQASLGADILLIDGSGALFDGVSPGLYDASDADVASLSRTPVLLVMDGLHAGNSAAAVFKGFHYYAQGFDLAGSIVNRIQEQHAEADRRDRNFYETVMQTMRVAPLIGGVPEAAFDLPELPREISQQFNLGALPRQFFVDLDALINRSVDLNALVEIANTAPPIELVNTAAVAQNRRCRIAVSDDVCFGLCYQDNLDLLRYHGAELVSFSPVADQNLPGELNGIYLAGAYLDEYARDIAANAGLAEQIRAFAEAGGPLYAEGSAIAYLCERYSAESGADYHTGAGIIRTTAEPEAEFVNYCDGAMIESSLVGDAGEVVKGVTTNRWKLTHQFPILKTLQVSQPGLRSTSEGFAPYANTFATFCFWHWGSCPRFAECFIETARGFAGVS